MPMAHSRMMARYPVTKIVGYYVVLAGIMVMLAEAADLSWLFPAMPVPPDVGAFRAGAVPPEPMAPQFDPGMMLVTAIGMIGALALVVPVAWVYMATKPVKGYDQSVTHTVIILPIVVAGIVLIVRDSVALAFSLAGIVAAVRFRNTLKDTKDAVYIFLAIGVGLASGMQALDVAFVMSATFNLVLLVLWRLNVGGGFRAPIPAGDEAAGLLMHGPTDANDKPFNGMLLIRATDADGVRSVAQDVFEEFTRRWSLLDVREDDEGEATLEYAVRMRKAATPSAVTDAIRSAGGAFVTGVEFRPVEKANTTS